MEEKLATGRWAEARDDVNAFYQYHMHHPDFEELTDHLLRIIYELENERDQLEEYLTQMKANTQWR